NRYRHRTTADRSGGDDASALEGPFLERIEDVVDFAELALLRNHSNLSLTGQLHQLPELVPIADEAPEDGEFGEDYIDGFHAQRPAIADDDQGPALVKHLHPVRKGQVIPDEVDHDVGTAIPGDVHDLLHGIPAGVDDAMSSHFLGEPKFAFGDIGGDNHG